MSETQHTPVPWQISDSANCPNDVHPLGIESADEWTIVDLNGDLKGGKEEAQANAEFICRAVNSHSQLVAALETAQKFFYNPTSFNPVEVERMYEEALKNARGGK